MSRPIAQSIRVASNDLSAPYQWKSETYTRDFRGGETYCRGKATVASPRPCTRVLRRLQRRFRIRKHFTENERSFDFPSLPPPTTPDRFGTSVGSSKTEEFLDSRVRGKRGASVLGPRSPRRARRRLGRARRVNIVFGHYRWPVRAHVIGQIIS